VLIEGEWPRQGNDIDARKLRRQPAESQYRNFSKKTSVGEGVYDMRRQRSSGLYIRFYVLILAHRYMV